MSTLALQLIAENKASRNPFLDLGNCGLTKLPQELAELTHLEGLLLANNYDKWIDGKYERIKSQNKGKSNKLSDITLLSHLYNLTELYCDGGIETNEKWDIEDISPLNGLSKLICLDLYGNKIKDINTLSSLTKLQHLWINGNLLTDISPIINLCKLKGLSISQNQIQDISPISQLTNLTQLSISQNQIQDISPISQLTNLTVLSISQNQIQDISPISQLTNLTVLYIFENQIQDISSISQLTNLYFKRDKFSI